MRATVVLVCAVLADAFHDQNYVSATLKGYLNGTLLLSSVNDVRHEVFVDGVQLSEGANTPRGVAPTTCADVDVNAYSYDNASVLAHTMDIDAWYDEKGCLKLAPMCVVTDQQILATTQSSGVDSGCPAANYTYEISAFGGPWATVDDLGDDASSLLLMYAASSSHMTNIRLAIRYTHGDEIYACCENSMSNVCANQTYATFPKPTCTSHEPNHVVVWVVGGLVLLVGLAVIACSTR